METLDTKTTNDITATRDTNFGMITVIVLILIIGMWIGTYFFFKGWQHTDRGTFGDMYGSINSLFSGLALAGIILTILLQRKELSLQRNELELTRQELRRTAIAQEKSEDALNRQAENLKISAKLTALNTLVNYYSDEEAKARKQQAPRDANQYAQTKRTYVEMIQEILTKENG